MYKLTPYGKSRRGLPGVNWRDLSDEEYEAALAANPGMDQRGYFEHVEDILEAGSVSGSGHVRGTTVARTTRIALDPVEADASDIVVRPGLKKENTDG